ncbi:MAG: hypothetical protein FKGGLIKP_00445 [Sodalis sp. Fse]|nr:MAG: hypothetical protein FKGGLIKP_00445 [Sodalis sp. Fse]
MQYLGLKFASSTELLASPLLYFMPLLFYFLPKLLLFYSWLVRMDWLIFCFVLGEML